jgi:hypothetical protein
MLVSPRRPIAAWHRLTLWTHFFLSTATLCLMIEQISSQRRFEKDNLFRSSIWYPWCMTWLDKLIGLKIYLY